jgi:hypothetical protein
MFSSFTFCLRRKVHVTLQTLQQLNGEYHSEDGTENAKNDAFLAKNNIRTFLIVPMFNPSDEVINNNQPFVDDRLIKTSFQKVQRKSSDASLVKQERPVLMSSVRELDWNFCVGSLETGCFWGFTKICGDSQ